MLARCVCVRRSVRRGSRSYTPSGRLGIPAIVAKRIARRGRGGVVRGGAGRRTRGVAACKLLDFHNEEVGPEAASARGRREGPLSRCPRSGAGARRGAGGLQLGRRQRWIRRAAPRSTTSLLPGQYLALRTMEAFWQAAWRRLPMRQCAARGCNSPDAGSPTG